MESRAAVFEALSPFRRWLLLTFMTTLFGIVIAWLSNQILTAETVKRALARTYLPALSMSYPNFPRAKFNAVNPFYSDQWKDGNPQAYEPNRASRESAAFEETLNAPNSPFKAEHRPPITIVSLDDQDLDALSLNWPVPMSYYGRLIRNLAKYEPRAIFLDVVFLDLRPRREIDSLKEAICDVATAPVPVTVYIASLSAGGRDSAIEDELVNATRRRRRDVQGSGHHDRDGSTKKDEIGLPIPCAHRVAANLRSDTFDRSLWEYPLRSAYRRTSKGQLIRYLPSPALALACEGERGNFHETALEVCERPGEAEPSEDGFASVDVMALKWPVRPPSLNEDLSLHQNPEGVYEPTCRSTVGVVDRFPLVARLFSGVRKLLIRLATGPANNPEWASDLRRANAIPCPDILVVPVRALNGQGLSEAHVSLSLNNRLLLIGTDFQSSGDTIYSPVQGPLPGVHAHAMALDNLLTYRDRWQRGGDFELFRPFTPIGLFTIGIVFAFSAALSLLDFYLHRHVDVSRARSAPFDRLFDRDVRLFPPPAGLPRRPYATLVRTVVAMKIFLLHTATFGHLPAPPSHHKWYRVLGILAIVAIFFQVLPIFLGWIGDHFRVGALSVSEYVLAPALLELFEGGERLSISALVAWQAAKHRKSAEWFRQARNGEHVRHDAPRQETDGHSSTLPAKE